MHEMKPKTNFQAISLIATQFLGALSDNSLKSAFGFAVTYQSFSVFGMEHSIALMMGALLFVCPYFLLSGLAGQIADHFNKVTIIRLTRLAEVGLAVLAAVAFHLQSGNLLLFCLFLYSVQSAFFGPAKFGLLPKIVKKSSLVGWNAALHSCTFLGILFGLIGGGVLAGNNQLLLFSLFLLMIALVSLATAFLLNGLVGQSSKTDRKYRRFGLISGTLSVVHLIFSSRKFLWPSLCISWFWTVGLVVVSLFPAVAKDVLNISANTANAAIGMFVAGCFIGAIVITKLLGSQISARYSASAIFLMALSLIAFSASLSMPDDSYRTAEPTTMASFFTSHGGIAIAFTMAVLAACSAAYVIPLYALLQIVTDNTNRSSLMAGGAILDSSLATFVSIGITLAFSSGVVFHQVLYFLALGCVVISIAIRFAFPQMNATGS